MPDLPPPPPEPAASWAERAAAVSDAVRGLRSGRGLRGVVSVVGAAVVAGAVLVAVTAAGAADPPELTLPRATAASSPSTTAAVEVVVHAAGAVQAPGLYRLRAGARVADVIEAAGGAAADADIDALNLAAPARDGERVYVPRRGEVTSHAVAVAASGAPQPLVDLNRATEAELDSLPGVGPATAKAIVAWREQHGRFTSVEQLLEVRGIGDAKLDTLRPLVRV